jgi:phage terminase large subunit GpA-like protein
MLTAEKKITKYFKGRPKREWVKIRTRNEALDCRVYATAALAILNLNLEAVYKQAQNRVSSGEPAPKKRAKISRERNFVTGY